MRPTLVKISVELLTKNQKNDTLNLYKERRRAIKRLVMENGDKNMDNNVSKNTGEIIKAPKIPQYEHKKISAFDAANYIIQLYFKTNEKYHCTKSKVEKLLSIAGFSYMAKNAETLYEQDIVVNPCGTGFVEFFGYFPPEIVKGVDNETNKAIEGELTTIVNEGVAIPLGYQDKYGELTDEDIAMLNSVFMRFGDYEPDKLGKAIDTFKMNISSDGNYGRQIIDPTKTYEYFQCNNNSNDIENAVENSVSERAEFLYQQIVSSDSDNTLSINADDEELVKKLFETIVKTQIEDEMIVKRTSQEIIDYIKRG